MEKCQLTGKLLDDGPVYRHIHLLGYTISREAYWDELPNCKGLDMSKKLTCLDVPEDIEVN